MKPIVQHKQKAELVKLRYFIGMTIEEAAKVLGISKPTAKRHWVYAWPVLGEHWNMATLTTSCSQNSDPRF